MTNMPSSENSGEMDDFPRQFELAKTGVGSDWLQANKTLEFAEFAYSRGYGVSVMEAYAVGESRGKLQLWHQILGIDDPGKNWIDHRNPEIALDLVKEKLREASKDAVELKYKLWIDVPVPEPG